MKSSVRLRFGLEVAIAATSAVLCVVSLITREWIESLTGWDPDHHSGSLEWILVIALAVVACAAAALARAEWTRRARSSEQVRAARS